MTIEAVKPRLGHAAARASSKHSAVVRRQVVASPAARLMSRAASCAGSGALYELPTAGGVIDSAQDTTIQWDPDCLDDVNNDIDIYLYAPQEPTANLPIHAWTGVPASKGKFDVKLAPKWWNATASVTLSLNIVPAGNQPWDSANPFGPTWTATYTAPTDGSKPPADAIVGSDDSNALISVFYKAGHLTPGGKAAAIICPLLVLFIGIAIMVRKMHLNRNNKTADWAEHMDKRMSQISIDWMDGGDGSAGPRPGSRPASFMARPQSSYRPSLEAVRAYYNSNVGGSYHEGEKNDEHMHDMSELDHYASAAEMMAQARTSNYRVSRVSFAPSSEIEGRTSMNNARTSMNNARTSRTSMPRVGGNNAGMRTSRTSRLYRNSQANSSMPRITSRLAREDSGVLADADGDEDDGEEFIMSPVQEAGAKPVDFDELMRQPIDNDLRNSVMNYPAAEMIRVNNDSRVENHTDDLEEAYAHAFTTEDTERSEYGNDEEEAEVVEEPIAPLPKQNGGMRSLLNAQSPDEAMHQYAMSRSASRASNNASRQGSTRRNGGGNILMRTLYRSNSVANTADKFSSASSNQGDHAGRATPARSNSAASSIRRKPVQRGSSIFIDGQ